MLTAEPRLRPPPEAIAARLAAVRADIDPGRLRQHVERLDQPRSRRHAAAGMTRAQAYVVDESDPPAGTCTGLRSASPVPP
jgi:hypothetical protein